MENRKGKAIVYISTLLFGLASLYLLVFAGNTNKYDSKTKAYRIYENESHTTDGYSYSPIYYFRVGEKEYECRSKMGSNSRPNQDKNIVYYDSENPEKCMTQFDQSSGKTAGIICLIATILIIYFFIIRRPKQKDFDNNQAVEIDPETQQNIEEKAEKAINMVRTIELIIKRVILGIIILVLLLIVLIESKIVKQTITAKNYIDTTATYVDYKGVSDDIFEDYIYTFKDKEGNDHEIVISLSKDDIPENEIKIKYDEKDPQKFYEEGMTFDKSGMVWFYVKIGILALLIILFFNKKLLNLISITSVRSN